MPSDRNTPPAMRRMIRVDRGAVSGGLNNESTRRSMVFIPMPTSDEAMGSCYASLPTAFNFHRERLEILRVDVGHESVAEVSLLPREHVETAGCLERSPDASHGRRRERGPRQS